jgi:hypothetical protein
VGSNPTIGLQLKRREDNTLRRFSLADATRRKAITGAITVPNSDIATFPEPTDTLDTVGHGEKPP